MKTPLLFPQYYAIDPYLTAFKISVLLDHLVSTFDFTTYEHAGIQFKAEYPMAPIEPYK